MIRKQLLCLVLLVGMVNCLLGISGEVEYDLVNELEIDNYIFCFSNWKGVYAKENEIFYHTYTGLNFFETDENGVLVNQHNLQVDDSLNGYDYYNDILAGYTVSYEDSTHLELKFFNIDDNDELNLINTLGLDTSSRDRGFQMYDEFCIVRKGINNCAIYSYDNNEMLSYHTNLSPLNNLRYDSNHGLFYNYDTMHTYFCEVSADSIEVIYDLGAEERNVKIVGNTMMTYSNSIADFYDIATGMELISSFMFPDGITLSGCYFDGDLLGVVNRTYSVPAEINFNIYDVSNPENIYLASTTNLERYPSTVQCGQSHMPYQYERILTIGNDLYIVSSAMIKHLNINGISISQEENLLTTNSYSSVSYNKNNKVYTNRSNGKRYLREFNCSDINNVTATTVIDRNESVKFYGDNYEYAVGKNYNTTTFYLYTADNNMSLTLTDSLCVGDETTDLGNMLSLGWDGISFVYYRENEVICYGHGTTDLTEKWRFTAYSQAPPFFPWCFSYANYIYILDPDNHSMDVYEYDTDSVTQVSSLYNSIFDYHFQGIDRSLFTMGNKVFDLAEDPVNFSDTIIHGMNYIRSLAKLHGDYMIFYGEKQSEHYYPKTYIYKKIDEEYICVGNIFMPESPLCLDIIGEEGSDNFAILANCCGIYRVYACQVTPNGDFEVEQIEISSSNYPNPFNPETTISYDLSKSGNVEVTIYNLKGQKVKTLVKDNQEKGNHQIVWNGENSKGEKVASGAYLYKVKAGENELVHKMMMVK